MPLTLAQLCGPDAEPHYVICGPHRYRVLVLSEEEYLAAVNTDPDDDRSDTLGICDRVAHIIYLRIAWKGTAPSESYGVENLLHEVLHIAWGNSGARHKHEEEAVRVLATPLLDILQKNRWLVDFLSAPLGADHMEPVMELAAEAPTAAEKALLGIRELMSGLNSKAIHPGLGNQINCYVADGLDGI